MADHKKILFVSNTLWSIYHFRFFIIKALIADGYEVVVLAPAGDSEEKFNNIPGLRFIPLKYMRPKGMSATEDYRLYHELKKRYHQINPDLIIHYTVKPNIYGCLAAKATGHQSVAVVTGKGYTLIKKGIIQSIVSLLYRRAFRSVREVWFLNTGDRDWFIQQAMVPSEKTYILPGEGIDTVYFQRTNNHSKPYAKTIFLMVARVLKSKGVREYAEAAKQILLQRKDAEFRLLGRYEENIPDAIDREEFSGWVENNILRYYSYTEDVKPLLAEADCFVLPSYSEGLSISLMEAASMELPVIASDIPGCRELVRESISGFLVPPEDAKALAAKMLYFLSIPEQKRKEMGMAGRNLIKENYDRKIITSIYKNKIRHWVPDLPQ